MVRDEKRRLGLFMGYHDMTRADVGSAVNISGARLAEAYREGYQRESDIRNRKTIEDYMDIRSKVLRDKVAADVSAAIGDGEVQVILPTDDKIVVLVDGEVLGWYNPDTGKIAKI